MIRKIWIDIDPLVDLARPRHLAPESLTINTALSIKSVSVVRFFLLRDYLCIRTETIKNRLLRSKYDQ